ncbi:MAG: Lpg1974 family pore-forming outer membrane protein [Sphingobacteriales bacterium JAD_PAG50586_3]|nr:MAG: Lpg1974 family pore-forming outer membrane protein [Sphingobacteriales bacterium JAD_PAG50586_3]
MIKRTLLTLTALSLFAFAQAQDSTRHRGGRGPMWEMDTDKTHHELGINVSGFIKTFITPANSTELSASANNYLLSYKTIFKNGAAIRAGLGGNYSNKNQTEDNFTGTLNVRNSQVNARVGAEWQFKLTRRWNFYTGLDFVYSGGTERSETPIDNINKAITESKFSGMGGGPVVGIQFRLNKRISLLAEGALYAMANKITDRSSIPAFPGNDSKEVTNEFNINFTGPQSIFLIITF